MSNSSPAKVQLEPGCERCGPLMIDRLSVRCVTERVHAPRREDDWPSPWLRHAAHARRLFCRRVTFRASARNRDFRSAASPDPFPLSLAWNSSRFRSRRSGTAIALARGHYRRSEQVGGRWSPSECGTRRDAGALHSTSSCSMSRRFLAAQENPLIHHRMSFGRSDVLGSCSASSEQPGLTRA